MASIPRLAFPAPARASGRRPFRSARRRMPCTSACTHGGRSGPHRAPCRERSRPRASRMASRGVRRDRATRRKPSTRSCRRMVSATGRTGVASSSTKSKALRADRSTASIRGDPSTSGRSSETWPATRTKKPPDSTRRIGTWSSAPSSHSPRPGRRGKAQGLGDRRPPEIRFDQQHAPARPPGERGGQTDRDGALALPGQSARDGHALRAAAAGRGPAAWPAEASALPRRRSGDPGGSRGSELPSRAVTTPSSRKRTSPEPPAGRASSITVSFLMPPCGRAAPRGAGCERARDRGGDPAAARRP